jgi:predicted DNA-binding transcriptional regulator AlpA
MTNTALPRAVTMIRTRPASALLGYSLATFYRQKKAGLLPPTVRIGENSEALALHEIEAINKARLRGDDDEKIRALVCELVDARKSE